MHGVLVINKPRGITSAKLARRLQRTYHIKKVGHGGTLDPDATGVLPICVNEATKIASYLLDFDKTYEGAFIFGLETDSQDISGKVVKKYPPRIIPTEKIRAEMKKMLGWQSQYPPMFSAVKIAGKPLYVYARQKQEVKPPARRVRVDAFECISHDGDEVRFRVRCSKGTYVRTLCHDLGKRLGTGGCLTELNRTRSGQFGIEDAISPEDLCADNIENAPHWKPLSLIFKSFPGAVLSSETSRRVQMGQTVRFQEMGRDELVTLAATKWVFFLDARQRPLAIAAPDQQQKRFNLLRVFNC